MAALNLLKMGNELPFRLFAGFASPLIFSDFSFFRFKFKCHSTTVSAIDFCLKNSASLILCDVLQANCVSTQNFPILNILRFLSAPTNDR